MNRPPTEVPVFVELTAAEAYLFGNLIPPPGEPEWHSGIAKIRKALRVARFLEVGIPFADPLFTHEAESERQGP